MSIESRLAKLEQRIGDGECVCKIAIIDDGEKPAAVVDEHCTACGGRVQPGHVRAVQFLRPLEDGEQADPVE